MLQLKLDDIQISPIYICYNLRVCPICKSNDVGVITFRAVIMISS